MKICSKCGVEKPLTEYHRKRGGHNASCKACVAAYCAANKDKIAERSAKHHALNKEAINARKKVNTLENYISNKKWAITYKGGSCYDCDGVFPLCVYDFHHLDPEVKEDHPGRMMRTTSREKLKAEIDKCVLLCANCHRIRHHGGVK